MNQNRDMPINDHYVWLIWASAFLIPWLMIYAGLPRFRVQMLKASLWTSLLGLTEPLFVPSYWNPPSREPDPWIRVRRHRHRPLSCFCRHPPAAISH